MAFGDPKLLKFDTQQILSFQSEVQDAACDLQDLKNSLLNRLEELKKDWKTPAGKKFIEEVDMDWAKQVEKYITFLDAVNELMDVAANNYTEVEEVTRKISF